MILPDCVAQLVRFLSKTPGVSERTAVRAILKFLQLREEEKEELLKAFAGLKRLGRCVECGLPAEGRLCKVCADTERDRETVCVVEQVEDALSVEKLGHYNGLYHILGGVISPLEGVGPEDLAIDSLLRRLKEHRIKKVILALNPTVEGEATAKFLADRLKGAGVKVYRIRHGIPFGGTIDMADELTLKKAFEDLKLIAGG